MKQLVFENIEGISKLKQTANETVSICNQLLTTFKSKHNHFSQPIDEKFAFDLVVNPLQVFDDLLRRNSPIKPIAGKPLDIEKLAELTGIDRAGFIQAFTIVLPGSVDIYTKQGRKGLYRLESNYRPLVSWQNDQFVLNNESLEMACENYRVYAESKAQQVEVAYWDNLAITLNSLIDRKIIDTIDANMFSQRIQLIKVEKGKFITDYKTLAGQIKSMVLVN